MSGMRMISDGIAMAEKQASCACSAHPCHFPGLVVPLTWPSRRSCPRGAAGGGSAARCRTRAPCEAKNNAQGTDMNECRHKVTAVSQLLSTLVQPPTFVQLTGPCTLPLPPSFPVFVV